MDNLDDRSYEGPLQGVCAAHSHLISARAAVRFNEVVEQASQDSLGPSLSAMLRVIASGAAPDTRMPDGQTTLLWLQKNMPATAEKILSQVRSLYETIAGPDSKAPSGEAPGRS